MVGRLRSQDVERLPKRVDLLERESFGIKLNTLVRNIGAS
jgi:hypothetical protein